jgi:hypothetical protein
MACPSKMCCSPLIDLLRITGTQMHKKKLEKLESLLLLQNDIQFQTVPIAVIGKENTTSTISLNYAQRLLTKCLHFFLFEGIVGLCVKLINNKLLLRLSISCVAAYEISQKKQQPVLK